MYTKVIKEENERFFEENSGWKTWTHETTDQEENSKLSNNQVKFPESERKRYIIHTGKIRTDSFLSEDKQSLTYRIPQQSCLSKTKANSRLWRIPGAGWLAAKIRHNGKLWAWLKILLQKLRQKSYHRFLITLASTHSQMHMCSQTYGNAYITDIHVHEKTEKVGKMFLFRPTNAG